MRYIVPNPLGATVTVFAPYDCKNNCPFCVNKKEYKDNPSFNMEKVTLAMKELHCITPKCDFVITGGEPFADLDKLGLLLDAIKELNDSGFFTHKVFINTTLPVQIGLMAFLRKYSDVITCLNVSRHVRPFVGDSTGIFESKILDDIIPVRINTVLTSAEDVLLYKEKVYDKLKQYKSIKGFQIREDYTKVNAANLYSISDLMRIFAETYNLKIKDIDDFIYDQYDQNNTFRWNYCITDKLSWHKTLPCSKITEFPSDDVQINDIVVTPQGKIMDDWNEYGTELDLGLYQ